MKTTATLLGLREDASEAEINAAIQSLQSNNGKFAVKIAEVAIAYAVRTGRCTAGEVDAQKALIAKMPIEGADALLARPELGAVPQQAQEQRAVNAGAAPAAPNPWAQHEAMTDPQLAHWYAQIMTDPQAVAYVAAQNPKLFARAENAFKVSR